MSAGARARGPAAAFLAAVLLASLACSTVGRLGARPTPAPAPLPTLDHTARQLEVFEALWTTLRDRYVRAGHDGVDWPAVGDTYRARVLAGVDDAAFAELMRALVAELPPGQASLETREERLAADAADARRYHGIGAFIAFRAEPEPHIVLLAVMEGSPAEQAGLQAHDSLYAINGEPVRADEAGNLAERVRGPAGSSVTLTVQSPGGARREVTVQRGEITAGDALRGGIEPTLNIAYFRLPVTADQAVAAAIAQTLAEQPQPLSGVILDLRVAHSSGGWPLEEMLILFADGALGEFYSRDGVTPLEIEGTDVGGSQTVPLVIVVGPDTQGSPEAFAGALRGAGRARVVGLPTPGDVEGYEEFLLADGSRLRLATTGFRTADGADLAREGVTPDLRVDADWETVTDQDDPVLEAALRLLND